MAPRNELNLFLGSTDGDPDLSLTGQECSIGEFVFGLAKEEFKKKKGNGSFETKVVASKENLSEIVDLFEKCEVSKILFIGNFEEWKPYRVNIIKRLREIVETMNSERFNCNVSKITGASVSAVAGAVTLGTVVCPPVGAVAIPLAITAAAVSGAGSATALGASITDICLLKKRVKKAKDILKQDAAFFNMMKKWFDHAKELAYAVQCVIGFELMAEISQDMKNLYEELKDAEKYNNATYDHKIKDVISECIIKMCRSTNVTVKFGIKVAPIIITFLFVRCMMHPNKLLVFGCVLTSIRTITAGVALADAIVDLASVFKAVSIIEKGGAGLRAGAAAGSGAGGTAGAGGGAGAAAGAGAVAENCARIALRSSLIGFGIALDLAVIALAAYDIHKGSVSEQSAQITEAADRLEDELEVLTKLHRELKLA